MECNPHHSPGSQGYYQPQLIFFSRNIPLMHLSLVHDNQQLKCVRREFS